MYKTRHSYFPWFWPILRRESYLTHKADKVLLMVAVFHSYLMVYIWYVLVSWFCVALMEDIVDFGDKTTYLVIMVSNYIGTPEPICCWHPTEKQPRL
jgi:hypothetical protein